MFFGSIKNDVIINIFLLSVVFIFSIIVWKRNKNAILGIFLFSALSNLIVYTDRFSPTFTAYNLKWLVKFSLNYWPLINLALFILLIINFIKNKYVKTKSD